jgi:hypothetical protein
VRAVKLSQRGIGIRKVKNFSEPPLYAGKVWKCTVSDHICMDFSFTIMVVGEQTSSRKGRAEIHTCSLQLWVKAVTDFKADLPDRQPFTGKYIPNFAERSCVVCRRALEQVLRMQSMSKTSINV